MRRRRHVAPWAGQIRDDLALVDARPRDAVEANIVSLAMGTLMFEDGHSGSSVALCAEGFERFQISSFCGTAANK